jgi:hypothetical protein
LTSVACRVPTTGLALVVAGKAAPCGIVEELGETTLLDALAARKDKLLLARCALEAELLVRVEAASLAPGGTALTVEDGGEGP